MYSSIPDDIEDIDNFKKFSIGSKQSPCTFDQISHAHTNDHTFTSFRTRLNTFLTALLGCPVNLKGNDMVSHLSNLISTR